MKINTKTIFLILVGVQGLHSVEEYFGKLWEVLPPTKWVCSLVSQNPRTGFIIINIALLLFGMGCWLFCFRKNKISIPGLIWFWVGLELINGVGHPFWSLTKMAYIPGLLTAPLLLILALYLSKRLISQ
jgi:xanthine/uracil permease